MAMKYRVQGQGEIQLTQADFKAQGGEGSIYVKGATAYKIYSDPKRMIPAAKIKELEALSQVNIVRPIDILLDSKNVAVGYSMRSVEKAFALCQLFPKVFRQKYNLTPEKVLQLVQKFQETVRHIHKQGILVVDLNEMNFLVAEDFKEIFFIDVDSYQTPLFPATALMESVRDRHSKNFSEQTDWFSFAVVSFQMFVGIHPYKGTYAPLQTIKDQNQRLDVRMVQNISVLHSGVIVPSACLPFDVIPPAYLDWYTAVLEEGKRLPPPDNVQAVILLAAQQVQRFSGSDIFAVREFLKFDGDVLVHIENSTITRMSVYIGGQKVCDNPSFHTHIAFTPRKRFVVLAYLKGAKVHIFDLTNRKEISFDSEADELMSTEGRLYMKRGSTFSEIEFVELYQSVIAKPNLVGEVLSHATQIFDGVAIQNLLGAYYASLLPQSGLCYQVRLKELDGYSIIEAKLSGPVLMLLCAKNGVYDRLVYRFNQNFSEYDVRIIQDVTPSSLNFITLESGVALFLNENDELEIFSSIKGAPGLKILSDTDTLKDAKLFKEGKQVFITKANNMFQLKMK